jgi:hypothetical protein
MLEGARKFTFPAGLLDGEPDAVLLPIPVPVVPYFRRFFAQMESPYVWKSRADFERAYPVFVEIEAQMTLASLSTLTESIERLYRLWDTSLNGTQYEVSELAGPDGRPIITPTIPTIPPASTSAPNAMRAHVGRMWHLAENSVAGETAPAEAGIDGAPALEDNQTARQLLRRLTAGVDGGGEPAPLDNLLVALRGTVQADTDRNVIDASGGDLVTLLDGVEALLAEIRDKLV